MAVNRRRRLFDTFRAPLNIALLSSCGLLSALLADGMWDRVSWLCLAVPTVIGLRSLAPRLT